MTTNTETKRRRTNEEILADMKTETKRPRRTNAEIARDAEKKRMAEEEATRAAGKVAKVVTFHEPLTLFGNMWKPGDEMWVHKDSIYYKLTHDTTGKFILDKSAETQKKLWGQVRYTVREEPYNGTNSTKHRNFL